MGDEVARTGGAKEFRYGKEDIKRIQSEDTPSTAEFKKALEDWDPGKKSYRTSENEPVKVFTPEDATPPNDWNKPGIQNPPEWETNPQGKDDWSHLYRTDNDQKMSWLQTILAILLVCGMVVGLYLLLISNGTL
jgi:hypothetical protein